VTLAALGLGGCADVSVFHAPAELAGFATTPKVGQDFIKETHPAKTEFTSVGVEPSHPDGKPRDAKGVKELQAELEAQRDTGHAILEKLSPQPPSSAAQTPEEKAKARIATKQKQKEGVARKAKDKDQPPDAAQAPQ